MAKLNNTDYYSFQYQKGKNMLTKKIITASVLMPAFLLMACAASYKAPKNVELGEIRIRNEMSKDIVITMAKEPLRCMGFTQKVSNIGGVEDHYFKVVLGQPVTLQFKELITVFSGKPCSGIVTINPRSGKPIEITLSEKKGVCSISSEFASPYVYVRKHLDTPVEGALCNDAMVGMPSGL
jgi:hypothetical protein